MYHHFFYPCLQITLPHEKRSEPDCNNQNNPEDTHTHGTPPHNTQLSLYGTPYPPHTEKPLQVKSLLNPLNAFILLISSLSDLFSLHSVITVYSSKFRHNKKKKCKRFLSYTSSRITQLTQIYKAVLPQGISCDPPQIRTSLKVYARSYRLYTHKLHCNYLHSLYPEIQLISLLFSRS